MRVVPCSDQTMSSHLSLTGKLWNLRRTEPVTNIVSTLRSERRIVDDPSAKLSNPFLFPEMKKAVTRIRKAIDDKEAVAIFGDYDADGITGTAQLVRYFRRHGLEPLVYLPHRTKEGYGMKKESIDALRKKGTSLMITVDTGIAAHAEIAHATALGIDTVVTDHHRVQGGRPAAFAVIHPLIPAPFPNEHLSGSGVAFMLVRALEDGKPWDGIDVDIALAAIGTVGDLVPLTGENRVLVLHGIKFMQALPPGPLADFIESVRTSGALTASDVAFRIVPRINAAGRMAHPETALQALLRGGMALEELHKLNGDRQTFVEELDTLLRNEDVSKHSFIVVGSDKVTPGTAGLLASRFTERYGKPGLVFAILGETAVGSLRSPEQIDVMKCLEHPLVKPLLLTFGGHAQAAGCTVRAADIPRLREALSLALREQLGPDEELLPTLSIDAELPSKSVTMRLAKELLSLSPFGTGNEEPTFLLRRQCLTDLRVVGAEGTHLQCRIGDIKCIGFRLGAFIDHLGGEQYVDVACRIGINEWQGRESVQVVIEDIRRSGSTSDK